MLAPWWYLLLWAPDRVDARLDKLVADGVLDARPNLWQAWLGVVYTWVRVFKRPETVGLSDGAPVRTTLRARLLDTRLMRLPAALATRSVFPIDQLGLGSSDTQLIRHLVGAYHPGKNLYYDLAILDTNPAAMVALRTRTQAIVDGTAPDAAFLRDLCVYDGYHEKLLAITSAWIDEGRLDREQTHPDTTLPAFMRWCAAQPETPGATLRALLAGQMSFTPADDVRTSG